MPGTEVPGRSVGSSSESCKDGTSSRAYSFRPKKTRPDRRPGRLQVQNKNGSLRLVTLHASSRHVGEIRRALRQGKHFLQQIPAATDRLVVVISTLRVRTGRGRSEDKVAAVAVLTASSRAPSRIRSACDQ